MTVIRISSADGASLFPVEEITALRLGDGVLEADVASLGIVTLAEGTESELADAARALLPGLAALGEGSFTVSAVREPGGGIGWDAVADDGSGGAGWAAASTGGSPDKPKPGGR